MSTKLTLNRREGVVAAQDIHLNRSVYSKPLVYSVKEVIVSEKPISYIEEINLAPKTSVATIISTEFTDKSENVLNIAIDVVFAEIELNPVEDRIFTEHTDKENPLTLLHENAFETTETPKVFEVVFTEFTDKTSASIIGIKHEYSTIVLDNFKDSIKYIPIKFTEEINEAEDPHIN